MISIKDPRQRHIMYIKNNTLDNIEIFTGEKIRLTDKFVAKSGDASYRFKVDNNVICIEERIDSE